MDIFFAIVGIILLLVAVLLFRAHLKWRATAQNCTGTITEVSSQLSKNSDGPGSSTLYYPTVKFTAEGREIEHRFKIGSNKRYTVGQAVTVFYQNGSPDRPQLSGLSLRMFASLFVTILSIVAFGWGYIKRQNEKDMHSLKEMMQSKEKH